MEGIPPFSEDVTTQMALFANWVRSGYMYPNDVIPPSDQIAQSVLFVIDQLPVSLDFSFAKENRFRRDRYSESLSLSHRQRALPVAPRPAAVGETGVRAFRVGGGHSGREQQPVERALPASEAPLRAALRGGEAAVAPHVGLRCGAER